MHVATLHDSIENWEATLPPGVYLLEDHNSAELLWHSRGFGAMQLEHQPKPKFAPETIRDEDRILVVRVGGFGDLIWLNAVYAALREKYFGLHIAHCCFGRYAPVMEGFIDAIVPYPLARDESEGYDHVVWLENAIEGKPCVDGEHPADRLAKLFHVELASRTAYKVTPEEQEWASETWPRNNRKRICVQPDSSTACKDYPHMAKVLHALNRKGYELLIVGAPRAAGTEDVPDGVFDATQKQFSVRQSIAMAADCDCILAPDSIFIHVGDALGIPVTGLFGPFDGLTYMDGYRGVSVQGSMPCSPCHWHPRGSAFPPGMPCIKHGACVALGSVSPDFIVIMVERALKMGKVEK